MEPQTNSDIHNRVLEAIRAKDEVALMRLLTEQVESTEGADKAYWLRYRAAAKRGFRQPDYQSSIEADLAEAARANPDDVTSIVFDALDRACSEQRLAHLTNLRHQMRHAVRKQMWGDWRFWRAVGYIQRHRRRFYQSYHAYTRALHLFLNLIKVKPEELRSNGGWAIPLYSWHARAAIRIGRKDEGLASVARASHIDAEKVRKHMNPLFLSLAQAEVAYAEGRYRVAIEHLQEGKNRAAAGQFRLSPLEQIDCDLVAARIARAEGNETGFLHFGERALAVAIEHKLPLSEVTVRAVLNGAMW
ncbi:MAG: hypothetical protein K0R39_188 [Symbiobacteriaceae bacterium]|jgi:hypothetical protein|nr:hypothetical protein [Symbiobacteriaceae bacterium]